MGDADDLAPRRQRAQLLADRVRGLPADPGVDLVEDEQVGRADASLATASSASITRDSLAAGGVSRSGAGGTPGFGAIRSSTASAPVGAGVLARRERDLEARVRPSPARQPRAHRVGERRRRLRRGVVQLAAAARGPLGPRLRQRAPWPPPARLGARQLVAPRPAARRACARTAAIEPPCLRSSRVERRQPLLDRLQPRRALRPAPRRSGAARPRRRPPPARAPAPLGERVEPRVDAGDRARAPRRGRQQRRGAAVTARRARPPRTPPAAAPRSAVRCRSRSRRATSSRLLGLVGRGRLDLAPARTRAGPARVARAGQLAQLRQRAPRARARARARRRAPRAPPRASGRRTRRAARAARGPASACGARAGRGRRAAAPPSSCRSATLARRAR